MIDKSQTEQMIFVATDYQYGTRDLMRHPNVLVYAIGPCPTCQGTGVLRYDDLDNDALTDICPDCPDNPGKGRVRVIPEATLRLLAECCFEWSLASAYVDPIIAQLIEEFTPDATMSGDGPTSHPQP